MKKEQIISIDGPNIYTHGGRRIAIGNADHKVGDWVWVDSGCVFGHTVPAHVPYIPPAEDVYIEVCDKHDHKFTFRLISISPSGKRIVKDFVCSVPITPTKYYGYTYYYFYYGHFAYDSQALAFLEFTEPVGMNVNIYANGEWTHGLLDARYLIKIEFIDGDLYWTGMGQKNCTITHYKNLTAIKSVDFTEKNNLLYNNFKSAAQSELNAFLVQCGSKQHYTITDSQITKRWSPYYEGEDIRASFTIFISILLYENSYEYHNYLFSFGKYYLGNECYLIERHLEFDDRVLVNNEHKYIDTDIIYGINSNYKLLSTTLVTYCTLVDTLNGVTYDWTPFASVLKPLLSEWYGTVIVITEINADKLYIYVEGAEFIFSKSENTLTAINEGEFYTANRQLTKMPKAAANKFIKAIKDKLGT